MALQLRLVPEPEREATLKALRIPQNFVHTCNGDARCINLKQASSAWQDGAHGCVCTRVRACVCFACANVPHGAFAVICVCVGGFRVPLGRSVVEALKDNVTARARRLHLAMMLWLVTCHEESIHEVRMA
jgi:hypothetical protein